MVIGGLTRNESKRGICDIDASCKDHDKLTKQDKEAVQDLMAFKERYKNGE